MCDLPKRCYSSLSHTPSLALHGINIGVPNGKLPHELGHRRSPRACAWLQDPDGQRPLEALSSPLRLRNPCLTHRFRYGTYTPVHRIRVFPLARVVTQSLHNNVRFSGALKTSSVGGGQNSVLGITAPTSTQLDPPTHKHGHKPELRTRRLRTKDRPRRLPWSSVLTPLLLCCTSSLCRSQETDKSKKDVVGIVVAICGSSHKDAVSRKDVCRIRTVWFESSQFPPRVHVSQP